MPNLETEIQKLIQNNNSLISLINPQDYQNQATQMSFKSIKDISFKFIKKLSPQIIKIKEYKINNPEKASKARHDLYAELTKINFQIDFLILANPEKLSEKVVSSLKEMKQNNKSLYEKIKTLLS